MGNFEKSHFFLDRLKEGSILNTVDPTINQQKIQQEWFIFLSKSLYLRE